MDILAIAATGNADKVFQDMRVRSLYSPYYFIKVVLGYEELVPGLHHRLLELFVTRWSEGQTKQAIELSRGFFKTTCFTIGCSMWGVLPVTEEDTRYALDELKIPMEDWVKRVSLHDQNATNLLAFETMPNAEKKIGIIKHHFESNEMFRALFPEIAYQPGQEGSWTNKCLIMRRPMGTKIAEGTFEAIGVDGALQSRHYTRVWEDDLVGKLATESITIMGSTIRWHGLLAGAFEDAGNQTRFLISNRWALEDLNGHVRKHEPDFVFYTISAIEVDPVTGQDRSTFPERYPLEKLIKIRDSGSMSRYDFSCQYLNSPRLPGEQEVDLAKLHHYEVESDGKMVCSCGATFYASQLIRYLHYDPYNAKGPRSSSCPALVAVGTSSDKHTFLLGYWSAKGSYAHVFQQIFTMGNRWRPTVFTYEDVGAQNMCEFYIKEEQKKPDFKGYRFPRILAIPTRNKPKDVRMRDYLFPVIRGEGGRAFSVRRSHISFENQIENFPGVSFEHDYDLLDATTQGATIWQYPMLEDDEKEYKSEDAEAIKRLGRPYSVMEVA